MLKLYPLMLLTSVNLGIYASVFIKMMDDTMDDKSDWSEDEKTSNALLCMLGLGTGEILGSLFFGRITDKCAYWKTVLANFIVTTIAFAFLILYGVLYDFSFGLALAMTLTWGVQDAGMMCLMNVLLGFQFVSKTTPFSVYHFVHSLLIFVVTCICSTTKTQTSYLIFFSVSLVIYLASWLFQYKYFKPLSTEQVTLMRKKAATEAATE
mmetsp:Transcript_23318/g.27367  ORF Transcript_23318/g.27367 Transcript_23318/m.27367 type:complete len:209 (-) Transcript_23318:185-811(-)